MLESDSEINVAGTAMNGVFALRKVESLNPDVIVLDLQMPELDGIGFLEERQKRGWDIPVVILSAVAKKGAEITIQALSLGASDFITKPSGASQTENQEIAEQLVGMVKAFGAAYRRKAVRAPESAASDREPAADRSYMPHSAPAPRRRVRMEDWPMLNPKCGPAPPRIIAIGISTGGPNA